MSYEQIARQQQAKEQVNKQVQTVYEDYKKIKGFKDVGYLLEDYVVNGGDVTQDLARNDTVHVTDTVVSLDNNILSRDGHSFNVTVPNTTYYLDFSKDGDWHWGLTHNGSAGVDYLAIASVTTSANGLVQTITDLRGHVGGTRFKDDFGLEQYAKNDYVDDQIDGVNAQLADKANQTSIVLLEDTKAEKTALEATNSVVALKANKDYVEQLVASVDATPESFDNLAAIEVAYPSGDSHVKLNLEDGYVYKWNGADWVQGWLYQSTGLGDDTVTYDKLASDALSKALNSTNIYPANTPITIGRYITNTGTFLSSANLGTSDFVPVRPNQVYCLPIRSTYPGCIFDASRTFISAITFIAGGSNDPAVFVTPSNAAYVMINANVVDDETDLYYETYMIVYGKTYPSNYVPYGAVATGVVVGESDIKNKSITGDHIKDILQNLFDKTSLTSGFINNTGGTNTSSTLAHSDPIEIDPNTAYSVPLVPGSPGGFYDASMVWISKINAVSGNTKLFITPSNAKYVIVNVNVSDPDSEIYKETYMLVKSNRYPDHYVPSGSKFIPWLLDVYIPSANGNGKWVGVIIYTFGDSITWYDGKAYTGNHNEQGNIAIGYQSYMREMLGAIVNNYGVSGRTLPQIYTIVQGYSYAGVGAVTLTGGVNDWYYQVVMGSISPIGSTFDTTTSYGALQAAIEYIISQNQKIKIYLMTPIRGMFKDDSTEPIAGQEFPETYADMFKEVGALYGIPVIDWYNLCGFNKLNYADWYQDKGTLGDRYIHVGDDGYKRMAEVLIPALLNN
jgi:lysophospholipase L1-like esterase